MRGLCLPVRFTVHSSVGRIACSDVYLTHICCCSWRRSEQARGLRLTFKPLAYTQRNGKGDKGEVGGRVRKCGGEEEQGNAEVLNQGRGEE